MSKVIGIGFGRVGGNDELLLKKALQGARDAGAEVELIRYSDYKILPCTGCGGCYRTEGMKCVLKDDLNALEEKIMEADGIIYASPCYIWGPTGGYHAMCDRFGPNRDRVLIKWRAGGDEQKAIEQTGIDPRIFKERVGGFIAVGGTLNPDYATMAISMMFRMTHSMQTRVLGTVECLHTTMPGQVGMHKDKIQEAYDLGKHIAESIGKPVEELKWIGPTGTCPYCHQNLFMVDNGAKTVKCCLCGIEGTLSKVKGRLHVEFGEDQAIKQRERDEEMIDHGVEIGNHLQLWEPNKDKVADQIKKYQEYEVKMVKPAPRS